jgi:pimeloyl-ACP methyl ester carboxylesterase
MTTSVSPSRVKAPALVLAGGRDLIHPPATVRQTAARLSAEFQVMREMSHWLPGEPGWDEAASACLTWLAGERRAVA